MGVVPMISDSIRRAANEHVVYFLLTAYVEARIHARQLNARDWTSAFPLDGEAAVLERLTMLRRGLDGQIRATFDRSALAGAFEVFTAAWERLGILRAQRSNERSAVAARGRERRRGEHDRPPPADLDVRARVYGPNPLLGGCAGVRMPADQPSSGSPEIT
jgi:hypothetical protein